MTILYVGSNILNYPSISAAMIDSTVGDTITLEGNYSNELALVTLNNLTFDGGAGSVGIVLHLAANISALTLAGAASIAVFDSGSGSIIFGNAGDNVITVTAGADAVDGGSGIDRLVVDYHLGTGAVTGDSTSHVTDAGGGRSVTITAGTIEHFTILTGAAADTLTTANGDDIIDAGAGANTITTGDGAKAITTVDDADTITAGNGNDTIAAGAGANTITAGNGADVVTSGDGADTITTGNGNATIHAGAGANTITVGSGANLITSGGDADTITALGGGNAVDAGDGNNTITTGDGNDTVLSGTGNDTIVLGGGDDLVTLRGGIDTVDAGAGTDRLIVDYAAMATAVTLALAADAVGAGYSGTAADQAGSSIGFLHVEAFTIFGGSGSDLINVGDADAMLRGGGGDDTLTGGAGHATASYSGGRGDYTITYDLAGHPVTIADDRGGSPDGTDTLIGITGLHFANTLPTGTVTIGGRPAEGHVLTAGNTLADADGLGPLHYQWLAAGVAIAGANGDSLTLTDAEVGQAISVVVGYTDGAGNAESLASAPTNAVIDLTHAPTGTVTIEGLAASERGPDRREHAGRCGRPRPAALPVAGEWRGHRRRDRRQLPHHPEPGRQGHDRRGRLRRGRHRRERDLGRDGRRCRLRRDRVPGDRGRQQARCLRPPPRPTRP